MASTVNSAEAAATKKGFNVFMGSVQHAQCPAELAGNQDKAVEYGFHSRADVQFTKPALQSARSHQATFYFACAQQAGRTAAPGGGKKCFVRDGLDRHVTKTSPTVRFSGIAQVGWAGCRFIG